MRHRPKRCSGHPQRRRVRHHYVRRLTCFTAPLPSRSNQQLVSDRTDGPPKVLTGAGPPPPDLDRTAHTSERTRPVGRHATADVGPPTHRGQGLRHGHPRTPPTALVAPRAYGSRRNCRYLRRRQIQAHHPGEEGSAGQPSATSQPRRLACGLRHEDVQRRNEVERAVKSARRPRSDCGPGRGSVRFPGAASSGQVRLDVVPIRAVQPQVLYRLPASVPARPVVAEARAGTPDSVSASAGSPVSWPWAQRPRHGEDRIRIGEGQLLDEVAPVIVIVIVIVIGVVAEAMSRDGLSDGGRSRGQSGGGADGRYLGAATNPGRR